MKKLAEQLAEVPYWTPSQGILKSGCNAMLHPDLLSPDATLSPAATHVTNSTVVCIGHGIVLLQKFVVMYPHVCYMQRSTWFQYVFILLTW